MGSEAKPSLIEAALGKQSALILGIGGGGDVIQGIPVARLLKQLGLEKIYLGGVGCSWWTPDGNPLSETWGTAVMGPTVYQVQDLSPIESLEPQIVQVKAETTLDGRVPCEAALADTLPGDVIFIAGLTGGSQGLADSLKDLVEREGIDLVVGVDIGSDTFYDGKNAMPAKTSLVDFISMGAMLELDCPIFYGVAGYGADGEMPLEELDERVQRVMAAGGYVGAHGLTQGDVAAMEAACDLYGDPVEPISWRAAKGEHGWKNVWTHGPWGTAVKVTPIAAVMLFFDPRTMAQVNSTGILAIQKSTSLAEAEAIFKEELNQYPESKLHPTIEFFPEEG
ncbi:DUF1152 domain-containing protein [Opitutia bacterium ISCC 51]|nr:DUF1152 domain-containing protein [Opitutae bacterium ISCC 51]QXD30180.1 DUF1152 domain-containing protein [Opitutae bacterium ISCC 52]